MLLHRRQKLKNYLLEPELQLKRVYYFVAFFFCMMGCGIFWLYMQVFFAVKFMSNEH